MKQNFTDLDDLIEKTHSDYTKKYFVEAIECYRSGAYRSSIVTLNIAVLTDIFEKIRDLSLDGDKKAGEYVKKIDNLYQKSNKEKNSYDLYKDMSDLEKSIREDAFKHFEFFSEKDDKVLEDIRYYRNICAHPLFYQNDRYNNFSPEMARSMIVEAANILFIHRATNGRAIKDILFELIKQKSFPEQISEIEETIFSPRYLGKAKNVVVIECAVAIFSAIFDPQYEIEKLKLAKIFSVLFKKKNDLIKDEIKKKLSKLSLTDKKLENLFYVIYFSNEFLGSIQKSEKVIVKRLERLIYTITMTEDLYKILYKISESNKKIKDNLDIRRMSDIQKLEKCSDFINAGKTLSKITSAYGKYLSIQDLQNILGIVESNHNFINNKYIEEFLINLFEKTESNYYLNDEDKFKNLWSSFSRNVLRSNQKSFTKLDGKIEEYDKIPF